MRKEKFLFIVPRLNEPQTVGKNPRKFMYYGVALMSSYLKENGFLTDIIDCQGKEINYKELKEKIYKEKPDYIGISAIYGNMDEVYLLSQKCKKIFPEIKIVLGGLPATFVYERIFKECPFIDICIIGEGEETILQLMKGRKIQKIKGIAYREGKSIFINKKREIVKNLDKYPFPDYSLFDSDSYKNNFVPYETSRGCPFACKFCCQGQKEGKKLREKSDERVISDFKKIAEMGFRKIMIVDNDFLTNMKRAKSIFKKVIDERINERIDFFWPLEFPTFFAEEKK
jgi:anaerobic magnesium-protoporphyrin IX monomethyl ester cyclase